MAVTREMSKTAREPNQNENGQSNNNVSKVEKIAVQSDHKAKVHASTYLLTSPGSRTRQKSIC